MSYETRLTSGDRCQHRQVNTATAKCEFALPLGDTSVRVRDRRGSGVSLTFNVGIESSAAVAAEAAERKAGSRAIDNREYIVLLLGAIWTSFCCGLSCKLTKLKSPILLYIRYTSYFRDPSNLGLCAVAQLCTSHLCALENNATLVREKSNNFNFN